MKVLEELARVETDTKTQRPIRSIAVSSCGLIDDKTGNDIPSTGMNNTCSQDDTKTISNTFAGISSTPLKSAFGTVSSIGGGAKSTGFTSPSSATSSTNTSTTGKEKSIFGTGGFGNTPSGIGSTNSSSAFGFGSLANTGLKPPSIFGNSKGVGGFCAFGNATNTESAKVNTTFGSLAANATTSSGPSPSIFGQTDRDGFGSFANLNSNTAARKKGLVFGNTTNPSALSFSAFGGCNGVPSSPSVFGNSNKTTNSSASPATTTAFGGTPFTPDSNAFAFTNISASRGIVASRGNESDDEDEDNSDSGYSSYNSDNEDSNIDANGNDSLSFGGGFASSLNM